MPRPKLVTLAIRDRKAFQAHVKSGLKLFGIARKELAPYDYEWVRNHMRASDPHFTHNVARKLFALISSNPKFLGAATEDSLQWVKAAYTLEAMNPRPSLPPPAIVPPKSIERLAESITSALIERKTIGKPKRAHVKRVIAEKLRQDAEMMALQFALGVGPRISDFYASNSAVDKGDVISQVVHHLYQGSDIDIGV